MKIKNNFVLHEVNLLCCNALQNIKFQTFVATVLRMCNENIPIKLKNNRFLFYLQYMTDMLELSIQLDTKGNRNTQCLFMVKYTQPQNIPLKKNCCSRVRVKENHVGQQDILTSTDSFLWTLADAKPKFSSLGDCKVLPPLLL